MSHQKEIELFLTNLIEQLKQVDNINHIMSASLNIFLEQRNTDDIINSIRKLGFFRPSKYDFNTNSIFQIFNIIKNNNKFKNYQSYFKNIENLFYISKKIRKNFLAIKNFLLSNNNLVKFLFAKADNIFFEAKPEDEPELTLECISFLVLQCKKFQYTHGLNITFINSISDKDFNRLLELANNIIRFKKLEIKIDFFDYELIKDYKNNYKIQNSFIEKNLSFSYLIDSQQKYITHQETYKNNDSEETFYKIIYKIIEKLGPDLTAEIRETPFTRVCSKVILHPELINIFATDNLYLEEASILNIFFKENFLESLDINNYIYKNFTLLDVIKIQRFYQYISLNYRLATASFFKKGKNKNKILLSSIIPISSKKNLNKQLNQIFNTNKNYYDLILKLISIEFYDLEDFFDIQYSPILSLGNEFLISPTILAKSNLIRSSLLRMKKNLSISNNTDKMITQINNQLIKTGFDVATEVKLGKYEIDIVAVKGKEVFIFECKNAYHPVNDFELRNTYAHIKKAANQLENLKKRLSNETTRRNLAKKIGFSLYQKNFHFSIINSNRIFNGIKYMNYRCINCFILMNVINEGLISINNTNYSLWENKKFNENDLVNLINGKFISDYENLAYENFLSWKIQELSIKTQRFGYSLVELADHIEKKYKKV